MLSRHINEDEITFETKMIIWHDGVEFFTKRWRLALSAKPRALVILIHGFAEHVGRYDYLCRRFAARNIEVFGYDQRGFGNSGPNVGDTTLEQQMADLKFAICEESKRLADLYDGERIPLFLYGHSMVRQVYIVHALQREADYCAVGRRRDSLATHSIWKCPNVFTGHSGYGVRRDLRRSMDLKDEGTLQPPSALVLWLIPWLVWIYPNFPFKKSLNPENLTSDPETINNLRKDPLTRGDVYLKTVSGLLLRGYEMLARDYEFWPKHIPILITHGDDDPSTSPVASQELIKKIRATDKIFKSWPGMLHEGHNERPELRDPFIEYSIG
ncbi:MAG: hypothetical protein Q9227_003987 [Pyrenula ochraceoflavens]